LESATTLLETVQKLTSFLQDLAEREKAASIASRDGLLSGDKELSVFQGHFDDIVSILEKESEMWVAQSIECDDADTVDVPCADAFIMSQGLYKLCVFAAEDTPRGSLPAVMHSVARLLRTVKYPLLPHKSIHKPIARLVFVGTRYAQLIGTVLSLSTG
jgi:hypothetical protein